MPCSHFCSIYVSISLFISSEKWVICRVTSFLEWKGRTHACLFMTHPPAAGSMARAEQSTSGCRLPTMDYRLPAHPGAVWGTTPCQHCQHYCRAGRVCDWYGAPKGKAEGQGAPSPQWAAYILPTLRTHLGRGVSMPPQSWEPCTALDGKHHQLPLHSSPRGS